MSIERISETFEEAVSQGKWVDAESLLFGFGRNELDEGILDPTSLCFMDGLLVLLGLGEAHHPEVLFLLRRQKYLEYLENRDSIAALESLRNELSPLKLAIDITRIQRLSSLLMCTTAEDVRASAHWDGAKGTSRSVLLSDILCVLGRSTTFDARPAQSGTGADHSGAQPYAAVRGLAFTEAVLSRVYGMGASDGLTIDDRATKTGQAEPTAPDIDMDLVPNPHFQITTETHEERCATARRKPGAHIGEWSDGTSVGAVPYSDRAEDDVSATAWAGSTTSDEMMDVAGHDDHPSADEVAITFDVEVGELPDSSDDTGTISDSDEEELATAPPAATHEEANPSVVRFAADRRRDNVRTVMHLACDSLSIGTWHHAGGSWHSGQDLGPNFEVFYSPGAACLAYCFTCEGDNFKIEYPSTWIEEIALHKGGADGEVSILLTRPPKFYTSDCYGENLIECSDFSPDQQATKSNMHCLGGPFEALKRCVDEIFSLEARRAKHPGSQPFPGSSFVRRMTGSPCASGLSRIDAAAGRVEMPLDSMSSMNDSVALRPGFWDLDPRAPLTLEIGIYCSTSATLSVFFDSKTDSISYLIRSVSGSYKMSYPIDWITNLPSMQGIEVGAHQIVIELSQAPRFSMQLAHFEHPDSSMSTCSQLEVWHRSVVDHARWVDCGDFTPYQQASKVMVHRLSGGPTGLLRQSLDQVRLLRSHRKASDCLNEYDARSPRPQEARYSSEAVWIRRGSPNFVHPGSTDHEEQGTSWALWDSPSTQVMDVNPWITPPAVQRPIHPLRKRRLLKAAA
ncbi:hypothetical protein LTR85_001124 [Meristemomyces frigidus]|nr:hypothetical protein LTR85_001124 [Meristemomyces frigidus]